MRRLSASLAAILATFAAGAQDIPFVPGQGTSEQLTEPQRQVARLAINALAADLQIAKEGILVDTIRAVDWPDSSYGCPQPGRAYLTVITPGHKITLRANGRDYAVHESNRRAFVCHQAKALGLPCNTARLLKIRSVEMAESGNRGPVPPSNDDGPRSATSTSPAIYYLSLDCGGKSYVARVARGTPGFQPDELSASTVLQVKEEDGKVFLRSNAGTEFEATLAVKNKGQAGDASLPP